MKSILLAAAFPGLPLLGRNQSLQTLFRSRQRDSNFRNYQKAKSSMSKKSPDWAMKGYAMKLTPAA